MQVNTAITAKNPRRCNKKKKDTNIQMPGPKHSMKEKKVELKQTPHLWVFIQIYFRSLFV